MKAYINKTNQQLIKKYKLSNFDINIILYKELKNGNVI